MKAFVAAAWGSLLFLSLAGCVSGGHTVVAQITDLEQQWVKALQDHDTAKLEQILADGFVDSTFRGSTRSRQDVLAGPGVAPTYRSIALEELDVRTYGRDTAIVTGVNVLEGAAAHDVVRVRFTDVFVRIRGRWRAVAAQETLQTNPRP